MQVLHDREDEKLFFLVATHGIIHTCIAYGLKRFTGLSVGGS